jgi:N5-(carboxyethyl)ornithine synthase
MNKLGFVVPTFPGERRVALLPEHIGTWGTAIAMEKGFGASMGIPDEDYIRKGVEMLSRSDVFGRCEDIFCLKLLQPIDYPHLRTGHCIIGWTHPTGSGATFMQEIVRPRGIRIVDLDNIAPKVYVGDASTLISWIPKNFIWKNSWLAGFAATNHALMSYGLKPSSQTEVAILSPGNVAQGAFAAISSFGASIRLFHRSTMSEFYSQLADFDIVINGIEMDRPGEHVLDRTQLNQLRGGTLVIDAAADAGNAIEGTRYTSIAEPLYEENGIVFYVVNNAPSIYYREASRNISDAFSTHVYPHGGSRFKALLG